jgi:hypothetical protein
LFPPFIDPNSVFAVKRRASSDANATTTAKNWKPIRITARPAVTVNENGGIVIRTTNASTDPGIRNTSRKIGSLRGTETVEDAFAVL